jgi:hypothetical protein
VEGLGPSTIDLTAAAWIMQHQTSIGMAKGEAVRVVKARLEEAGIGLPEPTYRLIGAGGAFSVAPGPKTAPVPPSPRRPNASKRRRSAPTSRKRWNRSSRWSAKPCRRTISCAARPRRNSVVLHVKKRGRGLNPRWGLSS